MRRPYLPANRFPAPVPAFPKFWPASSERVGPVPRRRSRPPAVVRRAAMCKRAALVSALLMFAVAPMAAAAPPAPAPHAGAQAVGGSVDELLSRPLALVVALALVSLLPFVFMTLTSFVKISTVLQIVRGAIGAQNVPSGTVVMALSAALTVLAMAPVGSRILERAAPLWEGKVRDTSALVTGLVEATRDPMRGFLQSNASERERVRFFDVAKKARP